MRQELRSHLAKKLPEYMLPSRWFEVKQLPLTSSGKIDRFRLRTDFQDVQELTSGDQNLLPSTRTEKQLIGIWKQLLKLDEISVADDFFELGGHSLLVVRLFSEIRRVFSVHLPLAMIYSLRTVREIGQVIDETLLGEVTPELPSLVPIQTDGERAPFFCIHARDGLTLKYRQLSEALGDNQPFYGLRSQGIEGDALPLQSIEAMAERYISEIQEVQPEGPYHLGGWSLGGWIAFEMARQLRAKGEKVGPVVIFDTRAHKHPNYKKALSLSQRVHFRLKAIQSNIRNHLNQAVKGSGPVSYFGSLVKRKASRGRKGPRQIVWEGEIPLYVEQVWNANRKALKRYQPRPADIKIALFRTEEDGAGAHYGWDELVGHQVQLFDVSGNHTTFLEPPNVDKLAAIMKALLVK